MIAHLLFALFAMSVAAVFILFGCTFEESDR